ncbi:MAG: hypothetical protein NC403_08430 [Muribaculaceae bacterium]|nr:hypothetical protein [Muribaculaceae bacterium]
MALTVTKLTPEQEQYLNDMASYGRELEQLAVASVGKYVIAGYAGKTTRPSKFYCYCGEGIGYKGACVCPANKNAVLFKSNAAAVVIATQQHYQNGIGESITLTVMPANEYFWQLYDQQCITMKEVERLMHSNAKNKIA